MTKDIEELAQQKLESLLSVIDTKKIISVDKAGIVYIGGVQQDKVVLQNLKQEAEMLLVSQLWQILYNTPKALAEKAMFVEGKTMEDLNKGRSMLFTLDTQRKILETLTQVK